MRRRCAAGEWKPGERLPAVADLAQPYGVARNTVTKALRRLADNGLVEIVPIWVHSAPAANPGLPNGMPASASSLRGVATAKEPNYEPTTADAGVTRLRLASFSQLDALSGHARRRSATVRTHLTSEKPVVRTHLRPPNLCN